MGPVLLLHVVSQLQSSLLRRMWGHRSHPSAACGVTVTVGTVHGCCGHPFCTACGVTGPFLPHVVLQLQSFMLHVVLQMLSVPRV